jgi:hypothetical protein
MSLPQIAQQLASKGRNGDTMLVHMSKDEVKGLASLAGANGMQLTINPETGLPEAFKLGKVLQAALPIAAGFALGPAGFGLMSSGMAGLTVGGLYGLATGSVEKGLMAGLGAWGGASLAGAGAGSAAPGTTGALTGPAATTVATPTAASLTAPLASSSTAIPTALGAQPTVAGLTSAAAPASSIGISTAAPASTLGSIAAPANALTYQAATPGIGSSIANFAKTNPWTTAALVGGPLLAGMEQDTPAAVEMDKGMIRPYTFAREVNRDAFKAPADGSTAERNYFANQRYTPLPAYEAANGGQVPNLNNMPAGGLSTLQGMRDGYAPMTTMDGDIPQFNLGGTINKVVSASAGDSSAPTKYTYDKENQRYNEVVPTQAATNNGLVGLMMRGLLGQDRPQNVQDPITGMIPYMMGNAMRGKFMGSGLSSLIEQLPQGGNPNAVGAYLTDDGKRYLPKLTYDPATQQFTDVTPRAPNPIDRLFGVQTPSDGAMANGGITGYSAGGVSDLGDYSDGGRLLKGPGDGVSDSISATINNKQPARLADGEFVIPARIVSELGNGSTDAGAKRLYAMMNRIQAGRKKTVGKGKVAVDSKAKKHLPA